MEGSQSNASRSCGKPLCVLGVHRYRRAIAFPACLSILLAFLIGLLVAGFPNVPFAQAPAETTTDNFANAASTLEAELAALSEEFGDPDLSPARLGEIATRVKDIQKEIELLRVQAQSDLAEPQRELKALGPAPTEDGVEEDPVIAEKRAAIRKRVSEIEARVKQSDLLATQAADLLRRTSVEQSEKLKRTLLARGPFLLSGRILSQAWTDAKAMLGAVSQVFSHARGDFQAMQPEAWRIAIAFVAVLAALALLWPLRLRLLQPFRRVASITDPTYTRRVVTACMRGFCNGILPFLALALSVFIVLRLGILPAQLELMLRALAAGAIVFIVVWQLSQSALSPDMPNWGIVPVTTKSARRMGPWFTLLAVVIGLRVFRENMFELFPPEHPALSSLVQWIGVTLLSVLMIGVLLSWRWQVPEDAREVRQVRRTGLRWSQVLWMLILLLAAMPILMIFGYGPLGDFIVPNLVSTGALIGLHFLLRQMLREGIGYVLSRRRRRRAEREAGAERTAVSPETEATFQKTLHFWLDFALHVIIGIPVLLALLLIWGVPRTEIDLLVGTVVYGFTIGDLEISLADVFWALVIFALTLWITRWLKRTLHDRILPHTGLDEGIKYPMTAAVGYLGFALAVTLGMAAIGVNTESLAIIFGALSVGIGFGLQHVVNNFVSGLILLFQRSVKVGDWIVVGANQGYVKRINIIGTEIETFDNAAVIVPNSNMVSSEVTNWHHHTKIGRAILAVGVAYGSDVEKVREILSKVVEENPEVLRRPEPRIYFMNFGASSLDFEVRFYLREIDWIVAVCSDLRFRIVKAFEEAGIEIPFPQQDLHLRSPGILPESAAADRS
jgi:small-conductance mechanosensitive channel